MSANSRAGHSTSRPALTLLTAMNDDPQLRELLRAALPEAQVPNRFGAEVWQRIGARSQTPANRWWARLFESVTATLVRPAFASLALLIAVGGGAGFATLHAAEVNENARTELAVRHVATVDPYARMFAAR